MLEQEYEAIKDPQELLLFLKNNIKYGWTGKDNQVRQNTIADFRSQFQLSSTDQVLKAGVGICFEQVELSRKVFDRQNIESVSYAIIGGRMIHTFIVFMINGLYYKLENADSLRSGIFKFNSLEELLREEVIHFMNYRKINTLDKVTLVQYDKLDDYTDYNGLMNKFIFENVKNIAFDVFNDSNTSSNKRH